MRRSPVAGKQDVTFCKASKVSIFTTTKAAHFGILHDSCHQIKVVFTGVNLYLSVLPALSSCSVIIIFLPSIPSSVVFYLDDPLIQPLIVQSL